MGTLIVIMSSFLLIICKKKIRIRLCLDPYSFEFVDSVMDLIILPDLTDSDPDPVAKKLHVNLKKSSKPFQYCGSVSGGSKINCLLNLFFPLKILKNFR